MMIHQIAHASIDAPGHGHGTKLDIVHNWCLRYLHTEFNFSQTSFGVCVCPYEFSECLGCVCAYTQIIEHALHLWCELGTAPGYWRKLKLKLDDKIMEQSLERWRMSSNEYFVAIYRRRLRWRTRRRWSKLESPSDGGVVRMWWREVDSPEFELSDHESLHFVTRWPLCE